MNGYLPRKKKRGLVKLNLIQKEFKNQMTILYPKQVMNKYLARKGKTKRNFHKKP